MKKCLVILFGECFRNGGQDSRARGHPASYNMQIDACESHIKYFLVLKTKYNIDTDVIIDSYSTQYDDELKMLYKDYLITCKFHSDVIGFNALYFDTFTHITNIDEYEFIHYIRIDMLIKDHFINTFQKTNKITYSFVCWIGGHQCSSNNNCPRVADMMVYIPSEYYYIFIRKVLMLDHESYGHLIANGLSKEDIGFFALTYHDSDSAKDWNPLYIIVNRPIAEKWHSTAYRLNQDTHEPVTVLE